MSNEAQWLCDAVLHCVHGRAEMADSWFSSVIEPPGAKQRRVMPAEAATPVLRLKSRASSSLFGNDIRRMVELLGGRAVLDISGCKVRSSAKPVVDSLVAEGLVVAREPVVDSDRDDYPSACFLPDREWPTIMIGEVRKKFAADSIFFVGEGDYGSVFRTRLAGSPDDEWVAVKISDVADRKNEAKAKKEVADNCRLLPLMLEHHTENFPRVYDAFLAQADVEWSEDRQKYKLVKLDTHEHPKLWIVEELVGKTFYHYTSTRYRTEFAFPTEIVFEECWLNFICAKYLGTSMSDTHEKNHCINENTPFVRAYHIDGDTYLFEKGTGMYKRIDIVLDEKGKMCPEGCGPVEPAVRMYTGYKPPEWYKDKKDYEFLADLAKTKPLARDNDFNAILKRYFKPVSAERLASLEESGEEVRHYYA